MQILPETPRALALLNAVSVIGIVYLLLLHPIQIDDRARDLLLVILGVLLSTYKDVYFHHFGSSSGSRAKDALIAKQSGELAVSTPPPPKP